MSFRALPVYVVAVCAVLGANAPSIASIPSCAIGVKGVSKSSYDFATSTVLHVPGGIDTLTVKVPVASTVQRTGWSQTITGASVTSVPSANSVADTTDAVGNTFKVLTFDHPKWGNISVSLKISTTTVADLAPTIPRVGFPLKNVSDEAKAYIKPSKLVESDDPTLSALSARLVSGATDESWAVNNIAMWVFSRMNYSMQAPRLLDARTAYKTKTARCKGYANLFIALARAAGIPARSVNGYTFDTDMDIPTSPDGSKSMTITLYDTAHTWLEVWFPGAGWMPYDPQMTSGWVDTHHILANVTPPGDEEHRLLSWVYYGDLTGAMSFDETQKTANVVDSLGIRYASGNATTDHVLLARSTDQMTSAGTSTSDALPVDFGRKRR